MLKVYNTLSRTKETFEPTNPPFVKMYVCGPTVYDRAHIGHGMSYIVFDMIRRYLEYRGYRVRHVQNFTDVEDKIIQRSQLTGTPWRTLTERYIHEFLAQMDALNVKRAHAYPFASREIAGIIGLIERLIAGEYAYSVDGNVYFRVTADDDYGKLSRRRLEEMQAGARVDPDPRKEHPMDFALWKASKPDEPSWESPWGPGRPGWHIECSAMSIRYLGPQIDIHGGGADLIFPHHENEIVQSESATRCAPFAKYWIHNGLLSLGGEKMSKSIGNFITIEEMLGKNDANTLRLFVLSSRYRSPLTFSEESFAAAERGLQRLYAALDPPADGTLHDAMSDGALWEAAQETVQQFEAAMDDDFGTPSALSALFGLARTINAARAAGAGPGFVEAQATLRELMSVLGFRLTTTTGREQQAAGEATPFIELLITIRDELRRQREWALADKIRNRLDAMGVTLEDTAEGATWRRRSESP